MARWYFPDAPVGLEVSVADRNGRALYFGKFPTDDLSKDPEAEEALRNLGAKEYTAPPRQMKLEEKKEVTNES